MTSTLGVRRLSERDYDRWSALLSASAQGSIYSSPEYLDALCSATGGRFQILAAERGEEIVGGAALYEERRAYGRAITNRLLLYYHPVVLREYTTRYPSERTSRGIETLSALAGHLDALPCARLVLHNPGLIDARPFLEHGWAARPSYSYVVPIADRQAAWNRVEQNLRRLITRCEAQGVLLADDDDFASLFRLHEQVHARKKAPLYLHEAAFGRFVARLRGSGLARIFHARLPGGQSVAAQLVLTGPYKTAHTVCAGADEGSLKLGTTPFLRFKAFSALAELGYEANDLTDAALGTVTRFKSQLGGDLVTNMVLERPERAAYRAYRSGQQAWAFARRLPPGIMRRVKKLLGA